MQVSGCLPASFEMIGNCASTVVGVKKNCEAILVIVAAGRQFFTLISNRESGEDSI
jgi:hypothetical protein